MSDRPQVILVSIKFKLGTFPVAQWLRLQASNAGGLGSTPGQGTGSRMLQLRVHMPQLKIPHAKTKTQSCQINRQQQHHQINSCISQNDFPISQYVKMSFINKSPEEGSKAGSP